MELNKETNPYESVSHKDISNKEMEKIFGKDMTEDTVAKAMGKKIADAFFEEIRGAEANDTLDQVPEKDRAPEPPSIEETLAELDERAAAGLEPITDEDIYNWIDGSEK